VAGRLVAGRVRKGRWRLVGMIGARHGVERTGWRSGPAAARLPSQVWRPPNLAMKGQI
jgi:hypothetical protein